MDDFVEIKGIYRREKEFKEIIEKLVNVESNDSRFLPLSKFQESELDPNEIVISHNILGNVVGIGLVKNYVVFKVSKKYNCVYLENDEAILSTLKEWLLLENVKNL